MALTIAAVAFIPRGAAGAGRRQGPSSSSSSSSSRPASAALTQAAAAFNGVLVPGEPLPAFGTCKHYVHSYRWAASRPCLPDPPLKPPP
jgi:hypothetical protein